MPPTPEPGADIELLIRSRYSLIVLDTIELEQAAVHEASARRDFDHPATFADDVRATD